MIKVALIGAGSMAEQHCRVYRQIDGVELVGVYSRTRERAEALAERHEIPAVYDSVDALAGTRADLALVTVKELGTLPVVEQAGKHDWTMFLEKPAGYNLPMARRVREAAERNGRTAYLGLNRRFYASTLHAQQELATCEGPRHINVFDQQNFAEARSLGHPEEVVRHFMYANSIHIVDYLMQFGRGSVVEVRRERDWLGEDTFLQAASVQFSSGDTGRYECLWNAPGPWSCSVSTAEKRLEMRPLESLAIQMAGSRRLTPVEPDMIDSTYKAGFFRQAEAMIATLGGSRDVMPSLADGLRTMELIHDIYGV